jgi:hypothetical protein
MSLTVLIFMSYFRAGHKLSPIRYLSHLVANNLVVHIPHQQSPAPFVIVFFPAATDSEYDLACHQSPRFYKYPARAIPLTF